jgi:hypothetical protein
MVPAQPVMTYYLVGSEEQRQAIETEAQWTRNDNVEYNSNPLWKFEVILMTGVADEDEEILRSIERERARWQAIGASGLEVVDLRQPELRFAAALQRTPVVIYLVESQARANNILASVREERADIESADVNTDFHAFKVTTAEEEAWVTGFVETLQGREIQIIDYRNLGPME